MLIFFMVSQNEKNGKVFKFSKKGQKKCPFFKNSEKSWIKKRCMRFL
jgi:hypothetical protein